MSSISHDVLSKRMKVMFKSFVVETYGGLHPEARWLLRQIAIRASGHHVAYSREAIVYGVRGSVAVAVQRGNAAVIRAANVKASETKALYAHELSYAGHGSAVAGAADAAAAVGVDEQASLAQLSESLLNTVAAVRLNVDAADVSSAIVLPTRARLHVVTPVASRMLVCIQMNGMFVMHNTLPLHHHPRHCYRHRSLNSVHYRVMTIVYTGEQRCRLVMSLM